MISSGDLASIGDWTPHAEGDVIDGKYVIKETLGRGGMGVVFAALHVDLNRKVAIKFLASEGLQAAERLLREARAAALLGGEHVVRVMDVGREASGLPYVVMEYLDGYDLSELLSRRGPLPVAEAVGYMLQICEALAEAHVRGIVHRDLKPANLFLARRPDGTKGIKVLDFGISKILKNDGQRDLAVTQVSTALGTTFYASPEQLLSASEVDARSDIWSLGVILYRLLFDDVPFAAISTAEALEEIVSEDPVRLPRAMPHPLIEQAVLGCLAKPRDLRISSVGVLADLLQPLAPPAQAGAAIRISKILAGAKTMTESVQSLAVSPTASGHAGELDTAAVDYALDVSARSLQGHEDEPSARDPLGAAAPPPIPQPVTGGMVSPRRTRARVSAWIALLSVIAFGVSAALWARRAREETARAAIGQEVPESLAPSAQSDGSSTTRPSSLPVPSAPVILDAPRDKAFEEPTPIVAADSGTRAQTAPVAHSTKRGSKPSGTSKAASSSSATSVGRDSFGGRK